MEFGVFAVFILIIFGINLYSKYLTFKELKETRYYKSEVKVINQYQKKSKRGKTYHVLKLKSDKGYKFITTSWEDLKDLRYKKLLVGIIAKDVTFYQFLKGFYAPTYDIRLLKYQDSFKQKALKFIQNQHQSSKMKELFSALFLATAISKSLRESISALGISHLVAISGFHLGVLFGVFYFLFSKIYQFFQNRYFPYRNKKFDLTLVIIVILFLYLYLLDFVPSVTRAFVMLVLGFFLYHRHIKIFSFEVLFVAVLTILAIFPEFLFSIGFWFSVSGVFYIYLFLHYFNHLKNWQIVILLNFWVYLAMVPIVHYIFSTFSLHQLYSPFISIAFSIFYPLEIALHLVGLGGLLDGVLESFLSMDIKTYTIYTPFWFLIFYLVISLVAIYKKGFLYLLITANIIFYIYMIVKTIL